MTIPMIEASLVAVKPMLVQPPALTPESVAAAQHQQAVEQVVGLANIINAILAARRGEDPQRVSDLPTEEARRVLDHARRSLAERDPIKVGVAHYRGVRALYAAIEDLFLGGVRQLTSAQRAAYRIAFYRALTAYQASLEGHLGDPNTEELASAIARKEPSV